MNTLDVNRIREDFPILKQKIYGKELVYLDNGATTQKPVRVIETINRLHREQNASIHRSVNLLSQKMTEEYEGARETVRRFIGAQNTAEIVFTSGTTASINAVAQTFGEAFLQVGDEVMVSAMEHHSNIVPWQMACQRHGAGIRVIPITDTGEIDLEAYLSLFSEKTRLVAVTHVSNTLGTVNPVRELIRIAHDHQVPVLIDGAQAIQHQKVDVTGLDCDFYAFSGHKVYGPTGIGVLYGKEEWLDRLPPWQGGGDMIEQVTFEKTTYNELPFKFEAGTTNFIGAVGLAEALNYLEETGMDAISRYEKELRIYTARVLEDFEGLQLYGRAPDKAAIFSFILPGIHPYDTGLVLDKLGIAVRTGTHCAMPVMQRYGIDGTVRASLCFYNTIGEVDRLAEGLKTVIGLMS